MTYNIVYEMITQSPDFIEAQEEAKKDMERINKLPEEERLKILNKSFDDIRELPFFRGFTPKSKFNHFKALNWELGPYTDSQFSKLFLDSVRDGSTLKEKIHAVIIFGKHLTPKRIKTSIQVAKQRLNKSSIS